MVHLWGEAWSISWMLRGPFVGRGLAQFWGETWSIYRVREAWSISGVRPSPVLG
jgi:hypothetical protein